MFAPLAPAGEAPACKIAGLIFSIEPLGDRLTLKDAGGYLKNVKVSSGTAISKLPVGAGGTITPIRLVDLNSGDIVCVHGARGHTAETVGCLALMSIAPKPIFWPDGR